MPRPAQQLGHCATPCHAVPAGQPHSCPTASHVALPSATSQIHVSPENQGGKEEAGGALRDEQWCPGRHWHRCRAAPFPRPGRLGTACGESVVSAVPNPKWLLRNGNPIKVLLVYLSSSGLFITVQMAATFARHSSVLARARRTEARAPRSLCVHLRGAGGRLLQRSRPGAGQCRLPVPQHPRTRQLPVLDGVCTGHWHQGWALGIGTGYVQWGCPAGVRTDHLHKVFAWRICIRVGHWALALGILHPWKCSRPG